LPTLTISTSTLLNFIGKSSVRIKQANPISPAIFGDSLITRLKTIQPDETGTHTMTPVTDEIQSFRPFRHRVTPIGAVGWSGMSFQAIFLFAIAFWFVLSLSAQSSCQGQLFKGRGRIHERSSLLPNRKVRQAEQRIIGKIRPGDELWILNTRQVQNLGDACHQACILCDVCAMQKNGPSWDSAPLDHLIDRINLDPVRENVIFIHGNRTNLQWATLRGTETYESVMNVHAGAISCLADTLPPVRWIIWAWPSDIIHGPKRDLEIKRQRAIDEGQILAAFLQRIEQPNLGVIAYSLGAQALVSALCSSQGMDNAAVYFQDISQNALTRSESIDALDEMSTPDSLLTEADLLDQASDTLGPTGTLAHQNSQGQSNHTDTTTPETEIYLHEIDKRFPQVMSSGRVANIATELATQVVSDSALKNSRKEKLSLETLQNQQPLQPSRDLDALLVGDRIPRRPIAKIANSSKTGVATPGTDSTRPPTTIDQPMLSSHCPGPKLRVVMLAAAVPANWFDSMAGQDCVRRCLSNLTLINNPDDRALDVYRKLTGLPALGTQDISIASIVPTILFTVRNNRIDNHIITEYLADSGTRTKIREGLFEVPSSLAPPEIIKP